MVGKILSEAPGYGYLHEPFNKEFGLEQVDVWYKYVNRELAGQAGFAQLIDDLLNYRASFKMPNSQDQWSKTIVRHYLVKSKLDWQYRLHKFNPFVKRFVLKDPLAALASEWLHQTFGIDVVVMVRHPAAFVSSLKRLSWDFPVSDILQQRVLVKKYLANEEEKLRNAETLVERAALLWKCVYKVLTIYSEQNEGIQVFRLEDLSLHPQKEVELMFQGLDLEPNASVLKKVEEFTNETNPVAAGSAIHKLKRNSRQSIRHWVQSLTHDEVQLVRELSSEISDVYYGPESWVGRFQYRRGLS